MRSVIQDIRRGRNIEAYAATAVAIIFALLGIIGDIVPEGIKWSAVFAAFAVLLYRIALPARPTRALDRSLGDRQGIEPGQLNTWLKNAEQMWVFAPSGVNLLSAENCDLLRRTILRRSDGQVRIAVLDPNNRPAIKLAKEQLDDSLAFPMQDLKTSLETVARQLRTMASWETAGSFEHRYVNLNPGFSLIAIDPHRKSGTVLVEFHGYANESTGSRMHILLDRTADERWSSYWIGQFESIWLSATPESEEID